jgi:hypothetical protein
MAEIPIVVVDVMRGDLRQGSHFHCPAGCHAGPLGHSRRSCHHRLCTIIGAGVLRRL